MRCPHLLLLLGSRLVLGAAPARTLSYRPGGSPCMLLYFLEIYVLTAVSLLRQPAADWAQAKGQIFICLRRAIRRIPQHIV